MDDAALVLDFLKHKELNQGRAAGTVDVYHAQLQRLISFLEERQRGLLSATSDDLREFVGLHLHQRGVAPRSRKPAVSAVRQMYRYLKERGLVSEDPAGRIEYPKLARRLPKAMHRRHVEALFQQTDVKTLKGIRDAAIISVLVGCGLRVAGVVSLNQSNVVSDVDEDGRELAILHVREKGGHERVLPVPDDVLLLIRAYLGHEDLEAINRELPDGDQVLFVNLRNRNIPAHEHYGERRRLSTNSIRAMLMDYGLKAGIPKAYLHPHAARHLFGVELAEGEIDLHVRSALMGHRSSESTKLYERMSLRRLRRALETAGPLRHIRTPVSGLRELLNRQARKPAARNPR